MTTPAYPRPLPPGWSAEWTGAGWIVGPERDEDVLALVAFTEAAETLRSAGRPEQAADVAAEAA